MKRTPMPPRKQPMKRTGKRKTKSPLTKMRERADEAFSIYIRSALRCARCAKPGRLRDFQCAHIVSRRYYPTRCVPDNAWCLCAGCHIRLTEWPNEHVAFAYQTIGRERYEDLCKLAQSGIRFKLGDWEAIAIDFETRNKETPS